jgi:Na+/H+ antiporter NhaC
LVFGFCIAASGRDFGPMFDAEQKRLSQKQEEETDTPFSWGAFSIAVIPLFILITYTGLDLYLQGVAKVGSDAPLFAIIGEADGYTSMLKGAIAFAFSTAILALLHRTPTQTIQKSISQGGAHLAEPLCVLALAWALGNAISELNTAQYLVGLLQQSLPHALLPSIVFVLAAGISFATGTSFGTMGTLMPLALPLAIQLQTTPEICLATAAAVLSGATWGDHCSPISDTTILSSAGAGCEHVSHVRTQLPYALTSGVISLLCCSLPIGFGIHWSICLLAGSLGCISWIFWRGRVPQEIIKEQESLPEESHSNSL